MKAKKKTLKTAKEPSSDTLTYVAIPLKLRQNVKALLNSGKIENPSDVKWVKEAFANPKENTKSTIAWFEKLVERKGAKFTCK